MINIAETRELYMFILSMVSSVVYIQPAVNDKCPGCIYTTELTIDKINIYNSLVSAILII